MLTEKQIKDFQSLYEKHCGKEINEKEALEEGIKIIRLLEIVYKPITKKEYKKYDQK